MKNIRFKVLIVVMMMILTFAFSVVAEYEPQVRQAEKEYLIGFANQTMGIDFTVKVQQGLKEAAQEAGVELYIVDNQRDPNKALTNADLMVRHDVDLFIEYQIHSDVNEVVAQKMEKADIPVIAIDIPVPGGYFFGGNNHLAGKVAGEWLASYAKEHWPNEKRPKLALVHDPRQGKINNQRMQGYKDAINQAFPEMTEKDIFMLDSEASRETAKNVTSAFLTAHPGENHILMGALHDGVAMGALSAVEQAGRSEDVVIVSQGADSTAIEELRGKEGSFKGSVAYFPSRYGENVIGMALDILAGRDIPKEVYVDHEVIDRENVDEVYPAEEE